ncbi:hypothetical protein TWF192_008055 [Orbilia oligospora]|nr:hypothetical protein TWF192_008055 [Orbilia oligospora]
MDLSSRSFVDSADRKDSLPLFLNLNDIYGTFHLEGPFESQFMSGLNRHNFDPFLFSGPNTPSLVTGPDSPVPIAKSTELRPFAQLEKSVSAGRSQGGAKRKFATRTCEVCSKSFSNLRMFGDHMLRDHGTKGFGCEKCNYRCSRYDNLGSHRKACKALPNKGTGAAKHHRVSMKNLTKSPATTDLGTAPETLSSLSLEKGSKIHRIITHETTSGLGHSTNSESNITNRISGDILSISPIDTQSNIRPVGSEISVSGVDGDELRELQDENEKLRKEVERLRKELKDSQFEASLWKRTSLELNSSHRGIA